MAFGSFIKELLKEQGKTVYWLSQKTGIPKTTLYAMIQRDSDPDLYSMASILAELSPEDYDLLGSGGAEFSPSKYMRKHKLANHDDAIRILRKSAMEDAQLLVTMQGEEVENLYAKAANVFLMLNNEGRKLWLSYGELLLPKYPIDL